LKGSTSKDGLFLIVKETFFFPRKVAAKNCDVTPDGGGSMYGSTAGVVTCLTHQYALRCFSFRLGMKEMTDTVTDNVAHSK
jgi:hypothetical protein